MNPTLTLFTTLLLAPMAALHAFDAPAKKPKGATKGKKPKAANEK